MLDEEMRYFLEYCRISDFSKKSIESLSIRLNEFNEFLKTTTVTSLIDISCQHLRRFIGDFKIPFVHIKKARVWSLRQFFHSRDIQYCADPHSEAKSGPKEARPLGPVFMPLFRPTMNTLVKPAPEDRFQPLNHTDLSRRLSEDS